MVVLGIDLDLDKLCHQTAGLIMTGTPAVAKFVIVMVYDVDAM